MTNKLNFNFDHIRSESQFNLSALYEINDNDTNDLEISPFNSLTCDYFDPNGFAKHFNELKGTSFFHQNCRGLSHNWESLKEVLAEMTTDSNLIDYIGLTEVYSSCDRDTRLSLPGYDKLMYRVRDSDDDGRGGVGMFIKEGTEYSLRNDLSVFIPHVF